MNMHKCRIMVAAYGAYEGTYEDNYAYSDFPFEADPACRGYVRSGYAPISDVDDDMAHMLRERRPSAWAVVEVEVAEDDLAFSDDYKGKGERMYGYPYSRWARNVDLGSRPLHLTLAAALAHPGLVSSGVWTPEMDAAATRREQLDDLHGARRAYDSASEDFEEARSEYQHMLDEFPADVVAEFMEKIND